MDISMESFHVGGRKVGALVRRLTPTQLRSLLVYRDGPRLRRTDHTLTHRGDVRDWTSCSLSTPEGSTSARRTDATTIDVDGTAHEIPADTIPSSAQTVVLEQMLAGSHTDEEFHVLDESTPQDAPRSAHLSVGNPETVQLPGRAEQELGMVTLFVDESASHHFWFDSHHVLAADWEGPRSYLVSSHDELLAGLDDEVAAAVREFIA
ncbi:hypothetical protein [uncultured Arsenicicoccus sp.]|uniref:hypothetical protein n=1 Tax=uncultured Arsenicicoccus sp. TaxID=491339 RepID=UPI002597BD3D|nr:hypothetical protein [uncultured Arsenicicoccus sp.]